MVLRHLDLFSGIGGFSLGLEATGGFETVAFCDIEEYPRKVLQKHWPHVKQYKDIKELNYEQLKADGLFPIDIITGGYPCQPFSVAGRKKGEEDPRHLWPEYFRLVKECRPTWVIGENVSGHLKLGLDTVLSDLESEGYAVRTFSISASSIGANHQRERVWIVANSNGSGNKKEEQGSSRKKKEEETSNRKNDSSTRFPDGTDTVFTRQGSETEVEHVAHSKSKRDKGELRNLHKEDEKISQSKEQHQDSSKQFSDASSNVENARCTQRQGSKLRGENENEIGEENADLTQRSGKASQYDVADTKGSSRNVNEADAGDGKLKAQEVFGNGSGFSGKSSWWAVEPDVGRVAHGVSKRVDRLKAIGNSLVPTIPYHIGTAILEVMED